MSEGHLKSFQDHFSQVPLEPNGESSGIIIKGGCEIKPNINFYYRKKIV